MRDHRSPVVASVLALSLAAAVVGCSASADEPSSKAPATASGPTASPGEAPGPGTAGPAAPKPPSGASLPRVTPPVRAALPAGLAGSPKGLTKGAPRSLALDPTDMKSRFFTEGPTSIFRLLALVDSSIGEINARIASGGAPCLDAEPVAYPLSPFGSSIPSSRSANREAPTASSSSAG